MFARISRIPTDLVYARNALLWLTYCPRVITLKELAVAAVIDQDSEFDDGRRLATCDDILEICGSFIRRGKKREIVELAHFSVTEFLASSTLPDGSANECFIDKDQANMILLKACFVYLSSRQFQIQTERKDHDEQISVLLKDDFYPQAACSWPKVAQPLSSQAHVANSIHQFLKSDGFKGWAMFWRYAIGPSHNPEDLNISALPADPDMYSFQMAVCRIVVPVPHNPLYAATQFSLPLVVEMLLEEGNSPNEPGGPFDYPLIAAILTDDKDLVRRLLAAGADPNLLASDGLTALHSAAMVGNVPLVRTLLEWNADVLALDRNNATPLINSLDPRGIFVHSPVSEPDPELLRLLLYDEIPTKLYSLQIPLAIAVSKGWTRSVNILLDKQGPSFRDWRDSKTGETMLHLAAKRGHVETVKLLRGAGALDEATDNCGWKPFHAAAVEFHTTVVRQFTNYSIDDSDVTEDQNLRDFASGIPPQQYKYDQPILHLAAAYPRDHILRLILANRAFRRGQIDLAMKLHQQSLTLNPRHNQENPSESMAHSMPCRNCEKEVKGNLWRCQKCDNVHCEACYRTHGTSQSCHFPLGKWGVHDFVDYATLVANIGL